MREHSLITAAQIAGGTAAAHGVAGDWLTPDLRGLIVSTVVGIVTALIREWYGRRKRAVPQLEVRKPPAGAP